MIENYLIVYMLVNTIAMIALYEMNKTRIINNMRDYLEIAHTVRDTQIYHAEVILQLAIRVKALEEPSWVIAARKAMEQE